MKTNYKFILPLILISALLILLAGCMTTPSDESPGVTGTGTITGTIAAPCCTTSADAVSNPPSDWCYYCENDWSLQKNIKVVLTYGEDEVATTTTNDKGEYTFTDVLPGSNYVVTAYCPDYDDNRPLVKDVALQVLEGKTFDTKITDCVSTAMGLVVDFLVENTTVLGPEEIVLDGVVAGMPNFYGFPAFKKLVERISKISAGCVNLFEDEWVPDYLCKAAEEVGRKVIPDLELGCTPGFTGGGDDDDDDEEENPCDDNAKPVITDVTLDCETIVSPEQLIVGIPYEFCVYATDDDILSQELTYSLTIDNIDDTDPSFDEPIGTNSNGFICLSEPLSFEQVGTYEVTVNVDDGCATTTWGPFTVIVDCCPFGDPGLVIEILEDTQEDTQQPNGIELKNRGTTTAVPINVTECGECVTISSITINLDGLEDIVITDFENDTLLDWGVIPDGIELTKTTNDGATVCLAEGASIELSYTINVSYTDSCGNIAEASLVITFEDCRQYTVTYNANAIDATGTVPDDPNNYVAGANVTVLGQGSVVRSGYTFDGWNTAADGTDNGGTDYIKDDIFAIGSANVILYAQWTEISTYTVTYNANAIDATGTVPDDPNNYVAGANVTVLGQGSVVRSGYTFDGWNAAADGSGNSEVDYAAGDTFAMGTSNVTLYAQWTQDLGSLTIKKVVLDYSSDWSFDFTISPAVDGDSTFTLTNTDSEITFDDLAVGTEYTITETAQDGWSVSGTNPRIITLSAGNNEVVFTNTFNVQEAIQNVLVTNPSSGLQTLVNNHPHGVFATMSVSTGSGNYPNSYFYVNLETDSASYDETGLNGWCITKNKSIDTGVSYTVILFPADNNNPSIGDKVGKVWGILEVADAGTYSVRNVRDAIWKATDGISISTSLNATYLFENANANATGSGIIAIPVTSKGMSSTNMFSRDRGIPVDKNK